MAREWLTFSLLEPDIPAGRTMVWAVTRFDTGEKLGKIAWYYRWHQYVLEPEPNTIWSQGCLQQVVNFMQANRGERRG